MFRLFRALIAVVLAGCLLVPVVTAIAQTESPTVEGALAFQADDPAAAGAAEAARLLSRLEGDRDFDALYDLLHPDSRAIAPRAAVVGWYETDLAGRRTAELTVTDVTFIEWTWPVTGVTYPRTAAVSFVQPYWTGETRSDVAAAVHLVEDDGEWGWFFGASLAFVDQQIALYAPEIPAPQPELPRPNEQQLALEAERAARFPDPLPRSRRRVLGRRVRGGRHPLRSAQRRDRLRQADHDRLRSGRSGDRGRLLLRPGRDDLLRRAVSRADRTRDRRLRLDRRGRPRVGPPRPAASSGSSWAPAPAAPATTARSRSSNRPIAWPAPTRRTPRRSVGSIPATSTRRCS